LQEAGKIENADAWLLVFSEMVDQLDAQLTQAKCNAEWQCWIIKPEGWLGAPSTQAIHQAIQYWKGMKKWIKGSQIPSQQLLAKQA